MVARPAAIPAMMKDTRTPGPASGTAWDSTKKMPVPTVEPTPNIVSWKVPIERLRVGAAPWATGAPITGRRRSICSVSVIGSGIAIRRLCPLRGFCARVV